MKTKNRFDFEQEIMGTWNIIDDLKCLADGWDELTEDKKLNIIIGLIDLYHLKFDTMFNTFEELIRQRVFNPKTPSSYENSMNREFGEDLMKDHGGWSSRSGVDTFDDGNGLTLTLSED